jgi:hypothetical protein
MEVEIIVLSEVPGSEEYRSHVFSHMSKLDLKANHIHKYNA